MFIFKISNTKNDSFCASYCLDKIYLTKVLGIDFKSAVLNLYYQRFSKNKYSNNYKVCNKYNYTSLYTRVYIQI